MNCFFYKSTLMILAGMAGILLSAQARINLVSLPGRDSVQLTIYNSADLTLVKEKRYLSFRKGNNHLEFSWANTLIDPTSVELRALTHADELDVLDVRFPPRVANTLEWNIHSEFAGEAQIEIQYFASGIKWMADYVGEASRDESRLTWAGQVKINNQSGEEFENAQFRLVVGEVRLVETIINLANVFKMAIVTNAVYFSMVDFDGDKAERLAERVDNFAVAGSKPMRSLAVKQKAREVMKEAMSEYYLYTIEGRDDLPNGWARRMPSMKTNDVPLTSYYKYEQEIDGRGDAHPRRFYRFTNSIPCRLGKEPFPEGSVKVFGVASDDQLYRFIGGTQLKYVPVGEVVELELGRDMEVLVKPVLTHWIKHDIQFDQKRNVKGWTIRETWEVEVQNSKNIPIQMDIRRNFTGDWSLQTTMIYEKLDERKVQFRFPLKPRETKRFSYEVTTRFGTNATR